MGPGKERTQLSASDHPEGLPSPGHVLKILALYFHYYKMLWSNQE